MSRVSRLPLRVRLVAGFSVAMLVVLTAAGAFVYWRVQYALDRGLDSDLDQASVTLSGLVDDDGRVPPEEAPPGLTWQVLDATGRVLDHSGVPTEDPLVDRATVVAAGDGAPLVREVGRLLPVSAHPLRLRVTELPTGDVLVVGVRRDLRDEALRELLLQLAVAGAGALLVTALVGERLARAALLPVERYRRRAREIASGSTGLRLEVPPGRDDEVTRLGHTLNEMLVELEQALAHERRFVDEASHELRTPLTVLSSRIQLARRRPRSTQEYEQVLVDLGADVARLTDLAEQLLALGSSESAAGGVGDLTAAARSVAERSAPARGTVELEIPDEEVPVDVDRTALERLVENLVTNASVHGRPPVGVAVDQPRGDDRTRWARLVVSDRGDGMDAGLLAAATGRFVRAPEARGRDGAGLGLSLVEAIVTRAGGELRLCCGDSHVGRGAPAPVACGHGPEMTVTVLLPAATPSGSGPR